MLLFLAEQIILSFILFHYVQDVYQKNQLGTRLDKNRHDTKSNHDQQKSKHRECQWRWQIWGILKSIKHLDWLKSDLNAAKIITVQNHQRTKN